MAEPAAQGARHAGPHDPGHSETDDELRFLARVVRHDLREPLRAVQGFSSGLVERYGERLDARGIDRLERVLSAASRLDGLLDALGAYLQAIALEPRREEVAGEALVAEVAEQLSDQIEAAGAELEVADPLPRVRVDREWATRALAELVANAIRFGADDSPRVVICERDGGFSIRDGGSGFPDDAEHCFPLFHRGVARDVPGLGAGLAIARAVARRHGGDVTVLSSGARGSEISIGFDAGLSEDDTGAGGKR